MQITRPSSVARAHATAARALAAATLSSELSLLQQWSELLVPEDLTYFVHGDERLATNPVLASFKRLTLDEFAVLEVLARREVPDQLVGKYGSRMVESVLGRLVLNWLVYLPGHEPNIAKPVVRLNLVYYAVTDGCNLRCPYCYASSERMLPGQLDTAESRDLIKQMAGMGARTIVFTGGEPMLRTDLFELAQYAVDLGLKVNMITNATLVRTAERAREIARLFTHVTVSLDGGTAEAHDITRGQGAFEKTAAALRLLNDADVVPTINHIVTNNNVDLLQDMADFLGSLRIARVRLMNHSDLGRGSTDSYAFGWDDHLKVQEFCWTTPGGAILLPDYDPGTRSGAIAGNCGMGGNEIYITSEGDVYACKLVTEVSRSVGNLRRSSLAELFASGDLARYRNATVGNGHLEDCARCYVRGACGGGCRAYHSAGTGDLGRNDRGLCRMLRQTQVSAFWLSSGVDREIVVRDRDEMMHPRLVATGKDHPVYDDWKTGKVRKLIPVSVG